MESVLLKQRHHIGLRPLDRTPMSRVTTLLLSLELKIS